MRRPVVATISGLSVALVGALTITAVGSQAAPSPQSATSAAAGHSAAQPLAKKTTAKTKKTKSSKTKSTKTKSSKTKTTKTKTTKTSKTSPVPTTTTTAPSGTFTGATVSTRYGDVQVQITVVAGKITASTALKYPHDNGVSTSINQAALPKLEAQVLAAQSAKIDGVSGATFTSTGYKTSLQSAIDALHA